MSGLLLFAVVALWWFVLRWVVKRIGNRLPNRPWRLVITLAIFTLLLPLPVIDEIVGGWQFSRLCNQHDKIQVDREKVRGTTIYFVPTRSVELMGMWVPVRRQAWTFVDKGMGAVVMQYDSFHANGGWLIRTLRISEGNVPLLFRDSCFPKENPVALTKSLNVTTLDLPAKN
jgi:hypothetical protein